jgi:hypothetical protein
MANQIQSANRREAIDSLWCMRDDNQWRASEQVEGEERSDAIESITRRLTEGEEERAREDRRRERDRTREEEED